EFAQLQAQLRMIGTGTSQLAQYANQIIFSGQAIRIQVGPQAAHIFTEDVIPSFGSIPALGSLINVATQGTASFKIDTMTNAGLALPKIISAIQEVAKLRATLGAEQNRIEFMLNGTQTYYQNLVSSESRIRDVDVAKETSEFTRRQILVQTGVAMLAQANVLPQNVLALLTR
ncbi:MAG: flagellin, partial [bacterium]|nr:flagellin [bacterium]MDW8163614.1 flagellin [Candidatus Omnitrophota bacterium]